MPSIATRRTTLAAFALVPLAVLPACNKHASSAKVVELDGTLTDWPGELGQWSDERYLYLRLSPPEVVTLQASAEPLALYLDADGNTATGVAPPSADGDREGALGADLMIVFSPGTTFPQLTDRPSGVAAAALYSDGSMRHVSHADLDFSFSPTFAAEQYEIRISYCSAANVGENEKSRSACETWRIDPSL